MLFLTSLHFLKLHKIIYFKILRYEIYLIKKEKKTDVDSQV